MSYKGKALMIGSASVGKTSLLGRYVDGKFTDGYNQTIGANFYIKELDIEDIIEKLDIDNKVKDDVKTKGFRIYWWDIGGQSDKLFVTEYYFLQAIGSIIVFDVTEKKTFDELDFWISKMKELSGDIPFIIVGNKIDLDNKRIVSYEMGKEKAEEYGVEYLETSAKENKNVNLAFEKLATLILKNIKS